MPLLQTSYWIYILYCANQSFYTGYTTHLLKRYRAHVTGTGGCKYTRSFKPLYIAQSWQVNGTKAQAMQIERAIKRLSRSAKQQLVDNPDQITQLIPLTQSIDLLVSGD